MFFQGKPLRWDDLPDQDREAIHEVMERQYREWWEEAPMEERRQAWGRFRHGVLSRAGVRLVVEDG